MNTCLHCFLTDQSTLTFSSGLCHPKHFVTLLPSCFSHPGSQFGIITFIHIYQVVYLRMMDHNLSYVKEQTVTGQDNKCVCININPLLATWGQCKWLTQLILTLTPIKLIWQTLQQSNTCLHTHRHGVIYKCIGHISQ